MPAGIMSENSITITNRATCWRERIRMHESGHLSAGTKGCRVAQHVSGQSSEHVSGNMSAGSRVSTSTCRATTGTDLGDFYGHTYMDWISDDPSLL